MKIYLNLGKTPTVSKQKRNKLILASRRNGKVKALHPASIRVLNLKGITQ